MSRSPIRAPDGSVPARLYWKPLVTLIWLGGAAMALGGGLSLADRRLRFGVAIKGEGRRALAGAAGAVGNGPASWSIQIDALAPFLPRGEGGAP